MYEQDHVLPSMRPNVTLSDAARAYVDMHLLDVRPVGQLLAVAVVPPKVVVVVDAEHRPRAHGGVNARRREVAVRHVARAHELEERHVAVAPDDALDLALRVLHVAGHAARARVLEQRPLAVAIWQVLVLGRMAVHDWHVHVREVAEPHPRVGRARDDGLHVYTLWRQQGGVAGCTGEASTLTKLVLHDSRMPAVNSLQQSWSGTTFEEAESERMGGAPAHTALQASTP
jgi:hypothetical protein